MSEVSGKAPGEDRDMLGLLYAPSFYRWELGMMGDGSRWVERRQERSQSLGTMA